MIHSQIECARCARTSVPCCGPMAQGLEAHTSGQHFGALKHFGASWTACKKIKKSEPPIIAPPKKGIPSPRTTHTPCIGAVFALLLSNFGFSSGFNLWHNIKVPDCVSTLRFLSGATLQFLIADRPTSLHRPSYRVSRISQNPRSGGCSGN